MVQNNSYGNDFQIVNTSELQMPVLFLSNGFLRKSKLMEVDNIG